MSIRVMSDVWRYSKQRGSSLLLLLAIADFADDEGFAYPAVKTLATKARISERSTQYAIQDLKKAGELLIQEKAGPHGTHLFRVQILHGANPAGVQSSAEIEAGGCNPAQKGVQPVAPKPSIEPSVKRTVSKKARKTRPPENLPISDSMKTWAIENGITADLEFETAKMLDFHRGAGNLKLDWHATWRTWMRNTKTWGARSSQAPSAQKMTAEQARDAVRKMREGYAPAS